jgi:hypothetical protein
MNAWGVDELAEGLADRGDIVHEIMYGRTEVFALFKQVRFHSQFFGLALEFLFHGGLIDHAAISIGPGDAEETALSLLVGEDIQELLKGGHYSIGEALCCDATEADVVVDVVGFHIHLILQTKLGCLCGSGNVEIRQLKGLFATAFGPIFIGPIRALRTGN